MRETKSISIKSTSIVLKPEMITDIKKNRTESKEHQWDESKKSTV